MFGAGSRYIPATIRSGLAAEPHMCTGSCTSYVSASAVEHWAKNAYICDHLNLGAQPFSAM